jgi:hypothetical protein
VKIKLTQPQVELEVLAELGKKKLSNTLYILVCTFIIIYESIMSTGPERDNIKPGSSCRNQKLLGLTSNFLVHPRSKARTSW